MNFGWMAPAASPEPFPLSMGHRQGKPFLSVISVDSVRDTLLLFFRFSLCSSEFSVSGVKKLLWSSNKGFSGPDGVATST
jgi:hypothetical protein